MWGVQVSQDHVFIVDHPLLQDGHNHTWNSSLIASMVADRVSQNHISQVRKAAVTSGSICRVLGKSVH